MQKLTLFILVAILFTAHTTIATETPLKTASALKNVTVYRTGAEMQHISSATLKQGNNELIIEGLSNAIDLNSIQVSCAAAVTLMGIEFQHNFLVEPQVNARTQKLKDSAQYLQNEIEKIRIQVATSQELLEVLKANKDIKGTQNGLSVAELVKLMDYYKLKSAEIQADLQEQKNKQKLWQEKLDKINTQVREEELKNTRKTGELKLQLSVALAGKYDFNISYITPNAYWTPYYDVRIDNIKNPLKLLYKSKIVQTTGIDWKKVKLALSTSSPGQWGNAPELKSWFLSYINPATAWEGRLQGKVAGISVEEQNSLQDVVVVGYGIAKREADEEKQIPMLYIVNGSEMSETEFRKISPAAIKETKKLGAAQGSALYGSRGSAGAVVVTLKEGLSDYVTVSDNQLNVVFDIELPYDITSNGKAQTAVLKEYEVPAGYQYYSAPRLDADAYLLAEVAEWEKLNLLPGEANIIFEGTYVGKSFIDPKSTSDTLNLTLSRDKRVVVKKEKLSDFSSTKFIGSNKVQKLSYEITVKNNKKEAITMLLKDQYPLATLKDIEVELMEHSNANINKETGLLSWKLDLAPGESKKIRIAYSVKYAKDRVININ